MNKEDSKGMLLGFIGILCFSLTLPATNVAVPYFGPTIVGLGRTVLAAILVIIIFMIKKESLPKRHTWKSLCIVAFGAVLAFPLLTTYAMQSLPVSHGAIELALLPLATAGFAMWRNKEKVTRRYWIASGIATVSVLGYAFYLGVGELQVGDFALLAAVIIVGLSYAEGGKLSKELGSWQVIAWAIIIGAPFFIVPVVLSIFTLPTNPPLIAWVSLLYLAFISQFLAYVAWYGGMALGGVARVGQIQYLQPFFMLLFSVLLLNEPFSWLSVVFALIVVFCVVVGKRG